MLQEGRPSVAQTELTSPVHPNIRWFFLAQSENHLPTALWAVHSCPPESPF